MIKDFRRDYPNLSITVSAVLIAGCTYLFHLLGWNGAQVSPQNIPMLCAFAAASVLLSTNAVQTAAIGRGETRNLRNPHFWIFAFYAGYAWCVLMLLFLWQGLDDLGLRLAPWLVVGSALGFQTAWWPQGNQQDFKAHYDLSKPATASRLGAALYYLWPVVTLVMILALLWVSVTTGLDESFFLIAVIFVPFIMPLYGRQGTLMKRMWPELLGTALLLFGLFVV